MGRAGRPARHVVTAAFLGVLFVGPLLAGCGDDDTDDAGTQPVPDGSSFAETGAFDDLPRHPRSEPFGTRSETDGVVTQSFRTTGVTPAQVLEFYADALEPEGWAPTEPVHRADVGPRGDWVMDDHRLEVSAMAVEDRQDPGSSDGVVQYSLVLRPVDD